MKILIADDHTIVREGIKLLLATAYPFADITAVCDSIELMNEVVKDNWDIIISDINMPPGDSGIDNIKKIKEHTPDTPVIILTMHSVKEYAVRAIKAGASGYLSKAAATNELIKAVNHVLGGKKYLSAEVAEMMADTFETNDGNQSVDDLSGREREVFTLMALDKPITEIAKEMGLSINTISTFRARIFEKMNFHSNTELIKYAVDNKLV